MSGRFVNFPGQFFQGPVGATIIGKYLTLPSLVDSRCAAVLFLFICWQAVRTLRRTRPNAPLDCPYLEQSEHLFLKASMLSTLVLAALRECCHAQTRHPMPRCITHI